MTGTARDGVVAEQVLDTLGMHSRISDASSNFSEICTTDQALLASNFGRRIVADANTTFGDLSTSGFEVYPIFRTQSERGAQSGWTVIGTVPESMSSGGGYFVTNRSGTVSASKIVGQSDSGLLRNFGSAGRWDCG
jgi:hypothetical protein